MIDINSISEITEEYLNSTRYQQHIEKLKELVNDYQHLISFDHHKSCDGHFSVITKFSYGDGPFYYAFHSGYINKGFDIKCSSYEGAIKVLINKLTKYCEAESEYIIKSDDEWTISFFNKNKELVNKYKTVNEIEIYEE